MLDKFFLLLLYIRSETVTEHANMPYNIAGRHGRMPGARNRLRTVWGLILLRPGIRQSSSSESFTEMNHPDVRILANRRYAWTS